MKKTMLLHQELSAAIASIGHTDVLALVDAGYSVPRDAHRIDLAVRPGLPDLPAVLETVLSELCVESYVLADEMTAANPALQSTLERLMAGTPSKCVPQSELKSRVTMAKAVVRTGEYSPFGNILLVGGVPLAFLQGTSADDEDRG